MRIIRRTAAALAASAVLFGLAGLAGPSPASAAGPTADSPVSASDVSASAITKRFTLTNESSRPLTLARYAARDRVLNESGLPAPGTVLQPGQQMSFDVVFHFLYVNSLHVFFSAPGLPDAYSATLTVSDGIALTSSSATGSGTFAHGGGRHVPVGAGPGGHRHRRRSGHPAGAVPDSHRLVPGGQRYVHVHPDRPGTVHRRHEEGGQLRQSDDG